MSISAISNNPACQTTGAANVSSYQHDLQNLGKSLQNGDLAGAQQSFAQLLQDRQSAGQSGSTAQTQGLHHHHHKGGKNAQGSSAPTASTTQDPTATAANQSALNLLSMPVSGILPADPSTAATSGIFL